MKKVTGLVLVILMVFIAVPAKSQLKFGVKGGLNISSVHMNSDILKADNVTGFQIGPMIETTIPLIGIGLDAAILYSQKGVDMKTEGTVTSTSMKTDYLDIPVNLKWKFGIPLVKAYLSAGPYVGFRVGGDKIWNVLGEQIKAKNFSAGLNFGVGAELISHLQVGINYGLGLTDNYSSDKFDMKAKNRGWSITAAVLF
ncbi:MULTISPECIES: porin family protein [Parabacteroides]|uniref:porin family protein n=1 Tax=Parabacteroides TaxID=375288 RepID=UPI000EFE8FD3|nr:MULTISPECIES: porin family protein [Parabacteroides]RHU25351.1 PorT family protein [Parabacteroides sp. TM07-1AC]WFE85286.1 porin family protein [Parabacteroides chongii]